LCFLGSAGTRADEIVNLKIEDIDLQKRRARVLRGKGGKPRIVRFSKWAAQLLRYWVGIKPNSTYLFCRLDGGKLAYAGLRQILRRLAERAEVDKNWQPHKFRHFSIAESLLQGRELTQISKNAGHADISTTVRHYTKFRPDGLDAMDEFDALNSVFGKND